MLFSLADYITRHKSSSAELETKAPNFAKEKFGCTFFSEPSFLWAKIIEKMATGWGREHAERKACWRGMESLNE